MKLAQFPRARSIHYNARVIVQRGESKMFERENIIFNFKRCKKRGGGEWRGEAGEKKIHVSNCKLLIKIQYDKESYEQMFELRN